MRAEADARAAREETMWRDAYTKRVEEKRQRWDEWDDMAAEEDTARKDRVARTNSRKPGSKTPSQRRDRLARYRDISRRADETWAASIERRWTADESYARTTGYKPRGDGVDRTMDWLFTPLAGAARKIDAWLEDDPYNPLTNPGYYGGYDAPPMPPPGQMYEQYDMPGGSAMNAMGWGGPRRMEERDDDGRAMRTQAPEYYSTRGGGPPPPYALLLLLRRRRPRDGARSGAGEVTRSATCSGAAAGTAAAVGAEPTGATRPSRRRSSKRSAAGPILTNTGAQPRAGAPAADAGEPLTLNRRRDTLSSYCT